MRPLRPRVLRAPVMAAAAAGAAQRAPGRDRQTRLRHTPLAALLDDEDLLEMVDAGRAPATLVDSHIAAAWRPLLPSVAIHNDVAVSQDATLAWAVRADAPGLLEQLNRFAPSAARFFTRTALGHGVAVVAAERATSGDPMAAVMGARAVLARAARDAVRMGFDPNRWFGQVEVAAARVLGREVVDYVRRLQQYAAAFERTFATPRGATPSTSRGQ